MNGRPPDAKHRRIPKDSVSTHECLKMLNSGRFRCDLGEISLVYWYVPVYLRFANLITSCPTKCFVCFPKSIRTHQRETHIDVQCVYYYSLGVAVQVRCIITSLLHISSMFT